MPVNKGGWIFNPREIDKVKSELQYPFLSQAGPQLASSGAGKTALLHEVFTKLRIKFPINDQKIGDCLKKSTLIHGPDFVKKVEDIKVGDRVYSGTGEITDVISTMQKKSYNNIVKIHTFGGLPLEVTADHEVLAYKFGKFSNNDKIYRRRYNINSKNSESTILKTRTAELIKAEELTEADYILCPVNIEIKDCVPSDFMNYMSCENSRWLIGLFLGDGHAVTRRKTLEWGCTTDQPEIESRLCKTLTDLGIKWRAYNHCKKSKKARKVYTLKIENLYNLFKKYFYDENNNKILPAWAINDDVIQGLLDSNGYKITTKSGKIYQCFENTSLSLVYGIRIWALNNGYIPLLNKRQRLDKRNGNLNKEVYSLRWTIDRSSKKIWRDDFYLAMPISKIEIIEGPHEEVYDIGVSHYSHTFITASGGVVSNCVSHASACACNVLRAVEISLGDNQKWIAETSTEDIYYGSRVVIGGNRIQGDGSIGAWAVKYMQRSSHGTLFRIKYDFADLSVYSGDRAKAWGSNRNVPSGLAQEAKKTPIDAYTACKNYEEVRDALANGYPVIVCSQQGFSQTRDAEGFAKPEGTWAHAMCFIAMDDKFKRPGVLCMNSWGPNWISGSKRHNQPDGSFWVDADIVNKMCKMGDTWAISGFNGFKKKPKMRII